ncbi:MAG TPA: NADH-quinone oxidoreductase subunit NuoE [Rhizomicrobium sp.]|nr:NADH-quinone oxidoreductase subunit NuoE [Rhizomicrobium sp.]
MSLRRLAPKELQPASFAFNEENEKKVAYEIAKYPPGRQASAVISLLWIGQGQEGWTTQAMIETIAKRLDMAFIRVLEVATFYTMFNLHPVGKFHLQVCTTPPCSLCGSDAIVDVCKKLIGPAQMTPTADGMLSWTEVECLGACTNAPVFQVYKDYYEDLTAESATKLIEAFRRGEQPKTGPQNSRKVSEPITGPNSLTDPTLYSGNRSLWADDANKTTEAPKPPGATS